MGSPAARADAPAKGPDEPARTVADVYQRHAAFVWRVVRRRGVPDAIAEDLMHEVFLVVHRRLAEYDGRSSMTTWLFHLARGVVSNWQRGLAREQARLLRVAPVADSSSDPEGGALRTQAQTFVHDFLAAIGDEQRDVFELVELEGESVPDVARSLGINLNTAYSRLRLARSAFAAAAAKWRGTEGGR